MACALGLLLYPDNTFAIKPCQALPIAAPRLTVGTPTSRTSAPAPSPAKLVALLLKNDPVSLEINSEE